MEYSERPSKRPCKSSQSKRQWVVGGAAQLYTTSSSAQLSKRDCKCKWAFGCKSERPRQQGNGRRLLVLAAQRFLSYPHDAIVITSSPSHSPDRG